MAFRNPVRSLPASAITGQITGAQLAPGAVDNTTITGSVVETAASGNRVVIESAIRNGQSVGEVNFYTEVSTDTPGQITAYGPADGSLRALEGVAPDYTGGPVAPFWKLSYEGDGSGSRFDVGADTAYVNKVQAASIITSGAVSVGGMLSAGNEAWGRVSITPVASTPTSVTITGLNLSGTTFVAQATADTSVPGTQVTGVGANNASATSVTIWLTRTNTTATIVYWALKGV